ncbi:MAG TPA: 50S ribosomal protein L31e [Nitrososphaera sp.]|nr:50S ribosomal protein L31e [Nitrososphaera sp.]
MAAAEENLTRVYTINLSKAWLTPQYRRTDRVVNMIREFAEKHMKSQEVKLDQDLNRQIWSRGKTNPPRKVRVKMVKDEDGAVTVSLYEDVPAPAEPVEEQKTEPAATQESAPPAAEAPKLETKAEEEKTEAATR